MNAIPAKAGQIRRERVVIQGYGAQRRTGIQEVGTGLASEAGA
jgi:hypothetical protein